MQQGETTDYSGPAQRLDDGDVFEIDGRFVVDEIRQGDDGEVAYLTDVRVGDTIAKTDRDLHRYRIRVGR